MLENISSKYILEIIFFWTIEKKKLELIKYNKFLQQKLGINIDNYKIFKGKYIIKEKNGTTLEYNAYNNNIIYEGGYLNGKKNGKGKEYDDEGKLIFDGEYSKGEKNGKGKEFDNRGNLIFDGD